MKEKLSHRDRERKRDGQNPTERQRKRQNIQKHKEAIGLDRQTELGLPTYSVQKPCDRYSTLRPAQDNSGLPSINERQSQR